MGPDAGQLYAMKVLKKASLKGIMTQLSLHTLKRLLLGVEFLLHTPVLCSSQGQSSH